MWLLTELEVPFKIKAHKRLPSKRAPPELLEVHPLGKAPVVEIVKENGKKLVLAESGHIIKYLIEQYDTKKTFTPKTPDDAEKVDYYTQFAEGSLQPPLVSLLIGELVKDKTPFLFKFFANQLVGTMAREVYVPDIDKMLRFLDKELENNKDRFFVGDSLTAADFILIFPIWDCVFQSDRMRAIGTANDLKKKYSHLWKWASTVVLLASYKTAKQLEDDELKNV